MDIKTKYNLDDNVFYLCENKNVPGQLRFVKGKIIEITTKSSNIQNYNDTITFEQSVKYKLEISGQIQTETRTSDFIEKDPIILIKRLIDIIPENFKISLSDLTKI